MNVLAGLVGYLSAVATVLMVCLLVYVNAERLETWARRRFRQR